VSPQELKMSASLVDNMATDFAPEKFGDEYQDQLKKLIAAKLEQGDKLDTAATFGEEGEKADEAEVIDLMEALRQSVERNRAARADGAAKKSTTKKAASSSKDTKDTKRAPAKKTAAKKAPAKKKATKKAS
jgi:DNA end-binding protein Ku